MERRQIVTAICVAVGAIVCIYSVAKILSGPTKTKKKRRYRLPDDGPSLSGLNKKMRRDSKANRHGRNGTRGSHHFGGDGGGGGGGGSSGNLGDGITNHRNGGSGSFTSDDSSGSQSDLLNGHRRRGLMDNASEPLTDEDETDSDDDEDDPQNFIISSVCKNDANERLLRKLTIRDAVHEDRDDIERIIQECFDESTQIHSIWSDLNEKGGILFEKVLTDEKDSIIAYAGVTSVFIKGGYEERSSRMGGTGGSGNGVGGGGGVDKKKVDKQQSKFMTSVREMNRGDLFADLDDDDESQSESGSNTPLMGAAAGARFHASLRRGPGSGKLVRSKLNGALIAPICVSKAYQRQRVGSLLVRYLMNTDLEEYSFVVAFGEGNFYRCFSFNAAQKYGFRCMLKEDQIGTDSFFITLRHKSRVLEFLRSRENVEKMRAEKKRRMLIHKGGSRTYEEDDSNDANDDNENSGSHDTDDDDSDEKDGQLSDDSDMGSHQAIVYCEPAFQALKLVQ